jgi:nitroreductase
MINGRDKRSAEYPVADLFIDRWSPRAMTGEALTHPELMSLFEAARWAPSSNNNQPWRMLYATRDSKHWPLFFDLLVEFNQSWVKNAAALVLLISRSHFEFNDKPSVTHSFDTGAAWSNLAHQGWLNGLVVHGMQGFDYERARITLNVPQGFQIEAMVAIGKPASPATLPDKLRERETPSDRRPLAKTICEGPFSL